MIRSALILFVFLSLPAALAAQEPGPAMTGTHTVQRGETLGSIARQYLGSAGAWTRLFEANRDRIVDPNRISPGLILVIPGGVAAQAEVWGDRPATVMGVAVNGEPLAPYLERQELARRREFVPAPAPAPTRERTIFYQERDPSMVAPVVTFATPEEVTAFPADVFHAAGWIRDVDESLGEIVGFAGDQDVRVGRTTVHPFDDVRIRMVVPGAPQVGDRFVAYRVRREVDGVGVVVNPTGLLEVRRVDDGGVIARVIAEYDRVELGHPVVRPRIFPLEAGVQAQPTGSELAATLMTFQDRKELHLPGDFAFIDRGADDGVGVGDEFVALAGSGDGWEGRFAARFQVVGVRSGTATVRLLTVEAPRDLRPGLRLHLDRKMP